MTDLLLKTRTFKLAGLKYRGAGQLVWPFVSFAIGFYVSCHADAAIWLEESGLSKLGVVFPPRFRGLSRGGLR